MSVKITQVCIACSACISKCPVGAIVDNDDNPENDYTYYVNPNKCVECVGHNDKPACANVCPTFDCIVWDKKTKGQPFRDEISDKDRDGTKACIS